MTGRDWLGLGLIVAGGYMLFLLLFVGLGNLFGLLP